jgi:hypothetical protein
LEMSLNLLTKLLLPGSKRNGLLLIAQPHFYQKTY